MIFRAAFALFLSGAAFSAEICETGREAFEKTVLTKIRKDCAECHAPGGRGPTFVLPDAGTSYLRVKNYVDFIDPERSTLSIRAGNNHCLKGNCNEASGKEMKTLLSAWWAGGERSCKNVGKYSTGGLPLPEDLPGPDGWKRMEWDLGSVREDLVGAKFSLEAQRYFTATAQAPGAYRFRKPRVHFAYDPIHVAGIRILLNGKYDHLANAYESIDQISAPQEVAGGGILEFPVLSSQPLILIEEKAKGDELSIAFDEIAVTDRPQCKAAGVFKENVMPILAKAECASCHMASGSRAAAEARASFAMELNDDQLCSAFLQRTDGGRPLRSVIIEMPARGKLNHPLVIAEPAPYLESIRIWMAAEGFALTLVPIESL